MHLQEIEINEKGVEKMSKSTIQKGKKDESY